MNKFFALFLACLFLIACNSKSGKKEDSSIYPQSRKTELVPAETDQMDSLYRQMTEIPLPLVYNTNFILNAPGFIPLPETMQELFHNYDQFDRNTRIAKLPVKGQFRPLLIIFQDSDGSDRMNLYTLSDSMKVIDRLMIYSIEKIKVDQVRILKDYEISENYRIMLRKTLSGVVIEQLYYTLDDHRCFIEIRDGKTPAIAFESPDDVHYMVETFLWDHHSNGGIFKKDLSIQYYKITDNGRMESINQTQYNKSL